MSRRNSLEEKKRRRVAKQFRASPESFIDLVAYVQERTNCSVATAHKVLLAGALRVDSHPVGYKWEGNRKVLSPYLPTKFRDKIVVQMPKELTDAN